MHLNPLLQLAAEFRQRAAAAGPEEQADLLFLADEYEAAATNGVAAISPTLSIKLPR